MFVLDEAERIERNVIGKTYQSYFDNIIFFKTLLIDGISYALKN